MGHHINSKGEFQSDKYPDLPPDKVVLSFKDPVAQKALELYAKLAHDVEFAEDICVRLKTIKQDK